MTFRDNRRGICIDENGTLDQHHRCIPECNHPTARVTFHAITDILHEDISAFYAEGFVHFFTPLLRIACFLTASAALFVPSPVCSTVPPTC